MRMSSALPLAAKHGKKRIVAALLDAGVDINVKTTDGQTALYLAAEYGHINIVETLLNSGADFEMKSGSEFEIALKNNQLKCATLIREFADKKQYELEMSYLVLALNFVFSPNQLGGIPEEVRFKILTMLPHDDVTWLKNIITKNNDAIQNITVTNIKHTLTLQRAQCVLEGASGVSKYFGLFAEMRHTMNNKKENKQQKVISINNKIAKFQKSHDENCDEAKLLTKFHLS